MIFVALRILMFFTIVTGIAYPLMMTGFAQAFFREKANGSLITRDGKIIGSELIGQKFEAPGHFSGRPSAVDYNPLPSGGSNLGPTSADLKAKIEELKKAGLSGDLLFASASGLDPHISPESARSEVPRVAQSLGIPTHQVMALVEQNTEPRQYLIFGEPRVNILRLNLALDEMIKRVK